MAVRLSNDGKLCIVNSRQFSCDFDEDEPLAIVRNRIPFNSSNLWRVLRRTTIRETTDVSFAKANLVITIRWSAISWDCSSFPTDRANSDCRFDILPRMHAQKASICRAGSEWEPRLTAFHSKLTIRHYQICTMG